MHAGTKFHFIMNYQPQATNILLMEVSPLVELLLGLVVAIMAAEVAGSEITISPHCLDRCGNIRIPYPFGVGDGCFMEGFELTCAKNGSLYMGHTMIEMIDISLTTPQVSVYKYMSYACYNESGLVDDRYHPVMNLSGTPFMFSSTRNKFTAIGCKTLAYFDKDEDMGDYLGGCFSSCRNESDVEVGACTGKGCCQTSIPKGMDYYDVVFDRSLNHSSVVSFSPCNYAVLADEEWYKFNLSDVVSGEFHRNNNRRVHLVLDWAIRNNGSCREGAKACRRNSECIDSTNGPGYICNCSAGFIGNPYLEDGCQDIDECTIGGDSYPCVGNCSNTPGSYDCSCPPGTSSDDPYRTMCMAVDEKQKQQESIATKIAVGGISCFLVIATSFLVYERANLMRAKRRCFEENGGLLLREQINAHQGVNFKIFKKEEMEKATRNFDPSLVQGQGGFGTVYKGELDDKKIVAIKISKNTNQKQRKEFAKEMYIVSLLNHKNVIKILGCCLEVEVPMLVYHFVNGGTLYEHIHDRRVKMPLDLRCKIAVESASALAYMHTDAEPQILHGDVKPSNILLDDQYKPILSDFGGALFSAMDAQLLEIKGTQGYLDPESFETGLLTEKSDVYSFAVVILELFTRRKVISDVAPQGPVNLVCIFKSSQKENKFIHMMDDEIKNEMKVEQCQELAKLLEQCLDVQGLSRPSMKEVEERLQRFAMSVMNQSVKSMEKRNPILMRATSNMPQSSNYVFSTDYFDRISGTPLTFVRDGR